MKFRPCIDLHNGQVKQIVGSTLNDEKDSKSLDTNFATDRPAGDYAKMYEKDEIPVSKFGEFLVVNKRKYQNSTQNHHASLSYFLIQMCFRWRH